mmetsp:Transcript_33976/g.30746  ORF Transcript_33976/g.30746 Transcript_33976/m.30746 type:complete len:96 (-) Transcript_33976:149-436(-)
MRDNANYEGFNPGDNIVKWFWEILESFSKEEVGHFLFFLTGSSRVPYGGFADDKSISLERNYDDYDDMLPIAHTCSYALEIPEYSSKKKMREKIV